MKYDNEYPGWGDILFVLGMILLGRLTISFIEAKLAGTFTASWLWVLAPVWIPVGGILVTAVVWGVIEAVTEYRQDHPSD